MSSANRTQSNSTELSCDFLFCICLLLCLCSLLLLSCLLLSILLWSFLNSSWLLSLGVLFCCYRCISSQVFIYSFIPYRWFKQFSSIRKSSKPMVRMPFSSLHGLISSFTTMTFLKVSLILRREAVSCFLFSSSGKASADCI